MGSVTVFWSIRKTADDDEGATCEVSSGKTAVVTGASRGIGLGIAQRLVEEGARVVVTARKPDALAEAVEQLGGAEHALAVPGKADDPDHQAEAVAAAVETFGSLDLLVNNTGINPVYGPLMEVDLGAARKIIDVNSVAALAWVQAAHRAWLGEHGGAVVNVASVAGLGPAPGIDVYGASKAMLISLTESLAVELGPRDPGQRGRTGRGEDPVRDGSLRGTRGGGLRGVPAQAAGRPRGRRQRGGVPALRRGLLDHRPDPRPRRRGDPQGQRRLGGPRVRVHRHQAELQQQLVARVGEAPPGELLDLLDPVDHGVAVAVQLLGGVLGRAVVARAARRGSRAASRRCGSGCASSGTERLLPSAAAAISGLPREQHLGQPLGDRHDRALARAARVSAARVASRKAVAKPAIPSGAAGHPDPAGRVRARTARPDRPRRAGRRRAARSRRPPRTCQREHDRRCRSRRSSTGVSGSSSAPSYSATTQATAASALIPSARARLGRELRVGTAPLDERVEDALLALQVAPLQPDALAPVGRRS